MNSKIANPLEAGHDHGQSPGFLMTAHRYVQVQLLYKLLSIHLIYQQKGPTTKNIKMNMK